MHLSLEAFPGSVGLLYSVYQDLYVTPQCYLVDLPARPLARLSRDNQRPLELPSCVTPSLKQDTLGSEYEPISHRLRLSPSA